MGHSLYFYDMLVEVTCEILFNLQKIPWACQNRRLQVMKGGVSCSWLFGGNFQKQCDVRRQGLVCAPILRMRITRRKGPSQHVIRASRSKHVVPKNTSINHWVKRLLLFKERTGKIKSQGWRRKEMLTTDMQSVAKIADMSLYYCGGYRKPIWSRKGLSINFEE